MIVPGRFVGTYRKDGQVWVRLDSGHAYSTLGTYSCTLLADLEYSISAAVVENKLASSKIAPSAISGSDAQEVRVDVQNWGGAPVAITSINVWTEWNMRKTDVVGFGIDATSRKKLPGITGPRLPFTLNGRHSQDWSFDDAWVQRMKKEARTQKVLIEVRLATGKSVYERMYLSFFDIGDSDDEPVEERPKGWVSRRLSRLHEESASTTVTGWAADQGRAWATKGPRYRDDLHARYGPRSDGELRGFTAIEG